MTQHLTCQMICCSVWFYTQKKLNNNDNKKFKIIPMQRFIFLRDPHFYNGPFSKKRHGY